MAETVGTRERERDLVLVQGEQAFVMDKTKGIVNVCVGPYKSSLSETDQPVRYDEETLRFVPCDLSQSITPWVFATEGQYVVLKNPAADKNKEHPEKGPADVTKLNNGVSLNIPGPIRFPLWPEQVAEVIDGHVLRSNQYLIVQIVNETEAKQNWDTAIMKRQTNIVEAVAPVSTESAEGGSDEKTDEGKKSSKAKAGGKVDQASDVVLTGKPSDLVTGQRLIIRGTEVSFYIPPTGVKVIPDAGAYVREAITLERLEYCILLDENGNKRYLVGPSVIFPEPTESFFEKDGVRKFRAIELNHLSGIHVKVIAEYEDDDGEHKVGEEIFITGDKTPIYLPRIEQAVIKYDDRIIHFAVAIPAGEGRYVLDRNAGAVKLIEGPRMFLPNPIDEVIVKRILSREQVELYYPGNREALDYNIGLAAVAGKQGGANFLEETPTRRTLGRASESGDVLRSAAKPEAFMAEDFDRSPTFTPPRTVTLDTKYEGAVTINVWPGFAVLIMDKMGKRRVVVGPEVIKLQYDEFLMSMELSTGKPKTTDNLLKTAYLCTANNKVSDILYLETKDMVNVEVKLSYRINFEGEDHGKWFMVDNYVKFATDHLRSLIAKEVRGRGIEDFQSNATEIIRDTVLGQHPAAGDTGRPGRAFSENGMRVYEVEVLKVTINDPTVSSLLIGAQQKNVADTIRVQTVERELAITKRTEEAKREGMLEANKTVVLQNDLELKKIDAKKKQQLAETQANADLQTAQATANASLKKQQQEAEVELRRQASEADITLARQRTEADIALGLQKLTSRIDQEKQDLEAQLARQAALEEINTADIARKKALMELDTEKVRAELATYIERLQADAKAFVDKAAGLTPNMVGALQAFGDKALLQKMADAIAPLAVLENKSVVEIVQQLFKNTPVEGVVGMLANLPNADQNNAR